MQNNPFAAPMTMPMGPMAPIDMEPRTIGLSPKNTVFVNSDTGAVHTENDDGSVVISFGSKGAKEPRKNAKFDDNLAEDMAEDDLTMISDYIMRGVDADIQSRQEWENTFSRGIDLLGLKLEEATTDVSQAGTVSKAYHPLLLEAIIRYQANASAELLPSAGPVKVRDDDPGTDPDRLKMAEALEKDYNHYFTSVAKEYYPDYRRMLFAQGFCGNGFKKIYRCPLRKRPVSDYVPAKDLIVSNDAISLTNTGRITHRTEMRHSVMKRMQIAGHYRDVHLHQPYSDPTAIDLKIKSVEGISPQINIPSDHPYTLYETYIEYDLPGFEDKKGSEETGLPLPYRVTLDKDSRTILEIRRNWKETDEDKMPRQRFVKYGFVPGLGFYDYGFVHILGNTARALTAIERQLIDAGQFSNFPGFLLSDVGGRQETTQIRIPPGGGMVIKTGGLPINQVVMPVPYKEPSGVLVSIAEKIEDNGRRLGGTNEVQVGEGRADVPVGTTIALIEQSTKTMAAVHKMNHESQQQEFELIHELFLEDPTALWKFARNPARKWEQVEELSDKELVPASDPNIPSHIHRVMQGTALAQLMQGVFAPDLQRRTVLQVILTTLGYSPSALMTPTEAPPAPAGPPPDPAKIIKAQTDAKREQREAETAVMEGKIRIQEKASELQDNKEERESRERIEKMKLDDERMREQREMIKDAVVHTTGLNDKAAERQSREGMHESKLASDQTIAEQAANKPVAE